MKNILTKIWNFIKSDWEQTRAWELWNIFFTGSMLVFICTSFISYLYGESYLYLSIMLWQIGYLLIWKLLESAQTRNREWNKLCRDIQGFSSELIEENQKLRELLNKIAEAVEENENK